MIPCHFRRPFASDFVSSVCSLVTVTSVSSPGGGLARREATTEGGNTKPVSVVSLPLGSHGVLFSNLCNSVFHCLEGMTLLNVRTLRTVPSHCAIDPSDSVSFPNHIPVCQAVSALFF